MPDTVKSATELLRDLDLAAAKQNQPKHFEFLLENIAKSSLSQTNFQEIRSSKLPASAGRLRETIQLPKPQRPAAAAKTEFEIERMPENAVRLGAHQIFDANKVFTVPDKVLGPFPTLDGTQIFYNLYKFIDDFKIFFPNEQQAAFILPVRLPRLLVANTRVSTLNLGSGNVWIRADLVDPAAPKTTYVGLRILSGTLSLGGTYILSNNTVQVPRQAIFEINLILDNSYAPADGGVGLDGKNSRFTPTDKLRLKTNHGRLLVLDIGQFSVKTVDWECGFTCTDHSLGWDPAQNYFALTLTPNQKRFSVRRSQSQLYSVSGEAGIESSTWLLPTRVLQNNQSVEVKFNGLLSLGLKKGIKATWDGVRNQNADAHFNNCTLMVFNGFFYLTSDKADFAYLRDHLTLWQKSAENKDRMTVDVRLMNYKTLNIASQSETGDVVSAFADTEFLIDKPLRADNTPVHPVSKKSLYSKILTKDAKSILIIDSDMLTEDLQNTSVYTNQVGNKFEKYQFALQNAYFTTTKESGLYLSGKYTDENEIYEGTLLLNFYILSLLPTLPHPYTTNVKNERQTRDQITGSLQSFTNWKSIDGTVLAEVTFKMNYVFEENEKPAFAVMAERSGIRGVPSIQNNFMLFDVSTQADHWGVALSLQNREEMRKLFQDDVTVTGENIVTVNRNYLQAPMGFLQGLTLPNVSWEPVNNITPRPEPLNPGDPPVPEPDMGILNQTPNTLPTVFSQTDNHWIRIHPADYMKQFKINLNSTAVTNQHLVGKVLFTLPNAKYSFATLYPYRNEPMHSSGHLEFVQPDFKFQNQEFRGGIQFRIAAYKDPNPEVPPRISGTTQQLRALTDQPGISILGETVTEIFNNVFSPQKPRGVPLTHFDFSGYGASTFSNWKNPAVKFASISQAKFDVLKGRTAHEIVQAVSMIYPWGICVTRTVTFLRNNNAVIFREDSGWVAQSEGLFDFSFTWPTATETLAFNNPYDIYPGIVQGLYKIKNIREDYTDVISGQYTTFANEYFLDENVPIVLASAPGKKVDYEFVAVYFDCDADLQPVDENITGTQFKGYLQIKPQGVPVPARILKTILNKSQNPVSGRIDALIPVENTLQKFKTTAVELSASYQNDNTSLPAFVASVKGSVVLPADGSWSVVEVDKNSGSVQNLKPGTSVGLVKDGLRPKNSGTPFSLNSTKTLLAYPDALRNTAATFSKTYGLLQNTDTQKLLLNSIEYTKGETEKYTSDPALLADCFRLMNSKGPFPNLSDAIKIDKLAKTTMNLLPDGVQKAFNYKVPTNFDFNIVGEENDAFRIYVKYTAIDEEGANTNESIIDYVTDTKSLKKWANQMHNITIAVDLAGFTPLMYISGNFSNEKKKNAGMSIGSGPQLKLDKTLQTIYDILEFLNNLDPSQPSEAVKKALKIAMSNSADSWEYKFKADKEIPLVKFPFDPINYNSPTTPLKMDAYFKVGVYFNQPIKIPKTIDQIKPSVGAYLELGADIRVMCVSVAAATIYAVGRAEVGLAADLSSPPALYFKFGFGIELAVGLPVIGSVAVTFIMGIDMKISGDLVVGAFIYFRGRAEILGGIVTISISIEAAGQVQKKIGGGPTNCIARCTFALDISIAFVVNISFTETWEETRQIS